MGGKIKKEFSCTIRESNPGQVLGRHLCYHYTNGAVFAYSPRILLNIPTVVLIKTNLEINNKNGKNKMRTKNERNISQFSIYSSSL